LAQAGFFAIHLCHDKTYADAILPKGHERQEKTGYKFDAGFLLQ
jgi:hypothetical protein